MYVAQCHLSAPNVYGFTSCHNFITTAKTNKYNTNIYMALHVPAIIINSSHKRVTVPRGRSAMYR